MENPLQFPYLIENSAANSCKSPPPSLTSHPTEPWSSRHPESTEAVNANSMSGILFAEIKVYMYRCRYNIIYLKRRMDIRGKEI